MKEGEFLGVDPGRSHVSSLITWPPPENVGDHLDALWRIVDEALPIGPVLDVGCGDGSLARLNAERSPDRRVVGIDMEPHPLWRHPRPENLIFVVGSAQSLPFEERAFGSVLVKDVLHHVPDPAAMLRRINTVARDQTVVVEANRFNPISYIWMVKIAKHDHFSRKKLREIVGKGTKLTSIETHVWPPRIRRIARFFEGWMNRWKIFSGLRNYNLAVVSHSPSASASEIDAI